MQNVSCQTPVLIFYNPNSRAGGFARPTFFEKESRQRNFLRNCVSPLKASREEIR